MASGVCRGVLLAFDSDDSSSSHAMSRFLVPRSTDSGVRGRAAEIAHNAVSLAHGSIGAYFGIGSAFQEQPAGQRIDPQGLAGYYCDFSHKVAPSERRPGHSLATVLDGGPSDWPMMVAQAGLGFWERHLTGEPVSGEFLALADWLVAHAQHSRARSRVAPQHRRAEVRDHRRLGLGNDPGRGDLRAAACPRPDRRGPLLRCGDGRLRPVHRCRRRRWRRPRFGRGAGGRGISHRDAHGGAERLDLRATGSARAARRIWR